MFDQLLVAKPGRSLRASSYDRTGGNRDFITVQPGETATLLDVVGPGLITHVYCAMVLPDPAEYRAAIRRMYWDGPDEPSVAVPLRDVFRIISGRVRDIRSLALTVNPGFGVSHGLNFYLPMPFSAGARITLENRGDTPLGGPLQAFRLNINYELYPDSSRTGDRPLRFHATFRQERPTTARGAEPNEQLPGGVNLGGTENYVALDATGAGHLAGLVLEIDNLQGKRWYGEGDDMVFIDDDSWPPSIHGTGTEEIFGGGACPATEYCGPYTWWSRPITTASPGCTAGTSTIRSGSPADCAGRWNTGTQTTSPTTTRRLPYWYQEPLAVADPLPGRDELAPRLDGDYAEARELLADTVRQASLDDDYLGEPYLLHLKAFQAG